MKCYLGLVLGIVVLASGCSKSTGGEAGARVNAWTQPHVFRYATSEDINTLNPHFGQQATLGLMASLTMAYLIKWDEHNQPYPELATAVPTKANGGVSADGLTITFHLRKGVKWSDGASFDADDVVFSTNVVNNPANNEVGTTGWNLIKKIDEPDKFTVVYHLSKPYSPFVETFFSSAGANPCVLPKHLLAQYPNINNVPYNAKPVGIGPFKYDRWDRAQQVVMVPNPTYWRGMPKLQKIVFKIVPDRNTVMSQLEAKELDMWFPASGAYIVRAQGLNGFSILRIPSYQYNHYDFNTTRPAVKEAAVRQALRMATDRQRIIDTIGHGVGSVSEVTTPRAAPYYVSDIPPVPFNVAGANALLDRAGWTRGPDGIRSKGGVKLALQFATATGSPDTDSQIELVRSWWKQIGADINVRHYPSQQLFAPLQQGGVIYAGNYDVVIFAWLNDAIGDSSSTYSCKSIPPAGQNNLHWCNPRAQAAYDALYSHYDQAERNKDVEVIERELTKDVPTFVSSMREDIFVYNKDLKNFHPNNVTPFDNMMDVDI